MAFMVVPRTSEFFLTGSEGKGAARPRPYTRTVIDVTGRAADLLAKADAAARRFNPSARIRVVPERDGVRFVLSDGPEEGDVAVERAGVTFFVDPTLDGVVDVEEPHDRLVLRSIDPRG
jgi:hypothetical protein